MIDDRFTETCANSVYGLRLFGEVHGVVCGKPIRPCEHPEHLLVNGEQLTIAWCGGWVHESGSPRCHHPDGKYGPDGAARPAKVTSTLPTGQ